MKKFYKVIIIVLLCLLSTNMNGCNYIPNEETSEKYSVFNFSGGDNYYCCNVNGKYYYISDDGLYERDLNTKKTVRLLQGEINIISTNDEYLYVIDTNHKLTVFNLSDSNAAPYLIEGSFTSVTVYGKDIFLEEVNKDGCIDYIKQDDLLNGVKNLQRNIIENIKNEKYIGKDDKYSYYAMEYGGYNICAGFDTDENNGTEIYGICPKSIIKDNHSSNYYYFYFGNLDKLIFNDLNIIEKNKENKENDLQGFMTSDSNVMKYGNNLYLLAQRNKKVPPVPYNLYEKDHEEDAIFKVDALTDKLNIIYRLDKKNGRIIGYKNNNVYIYKSGKITSYNLDKKTTKEVAKIKEAYHMTFEMCGNYIFVIGRDKNRESSPYLYTNEKKVIKEAIKLGD